MKVIAKTKYNDIARVYVAESGEQSLFGEQKLVEFVESVQPPIPKEEKWVLIVSTLFGCPVKCKFCDSGGFYNGKLSKDDIFAQIDYLIKQSFPDRKVPVKKFKIQFARMGEPAFNESVLDVLEEFHERYNAPGFLPSISTIAPKGCDDFFERMLEIKNRLYRNNFQLQFSIHSTNEAQRNELMPVKKMSFSEIAEYGEYFYNKGNRKITLNFALSDESEMDSEVLGKYFDPRVFIIKLTPVNPTYKARDNNINSSFDIRILHADKIEALEKAGYDVIISIGELEENNIGSNCGQHIMNFMNENKSMANSYTYELEKC